MSEYPPGDGEIAVGEAPAPQLLVATAVTLRKILKNRGHFPSDEAAAKLIYLALKNITRKWKRPPLTWKKAMSQFAILFTERLDGSHS